MSIDNEPIGGYGKVPIEAVRHLSEALELILAHSPDMIFSHGTTATFWHLIAILNNKLLPRPEN